MTRTRPTKERVDSLIIDCAPHATGMYADLCAEIEALRIDLGLAQAQIDRYQSAILYIPHYPAAVVDEFISICKQYIRQNRVLLDGLVAPLLAVLRSRDPNL